MFCNLVVVSQLVLEFGLTLLGGWVTLQSPQEFGFNFLVDEHHSLSACNAHKLSPNPLTKEGDHSVPPGFCCRPLDGLDYQ